MNVLRAVVFLLLKLVVLLILDSKLDMFFCLLLVVALEKTEPADVAWLFAPLALALLLLLPFIAVVLVVEIIDLAMLVVVV